MAPAAVFRILAGEKKTPTEAAGKVFEAVVILVVAVAFAGEKVMQRVVEIIIPHGIQTPTAAIAGTHHVRIIGSAFGHEVNEALGARGGAFDGRSQFANERAGGNIENGVDGVK